MIQYTSTYQRHAEITFSNIFIPHYFFVFTWLQNDYNNPMFILNLIIIFFKT